MKKEIGELEGQEGYKKKETGYNMYTTPNMNVNCMNCKHILIKDNYFKTLSFPYFPFF